MNAKHLLPLLLVVACGGHEASTTDIGAPAPADTGGGSGSASSDPQASPAPGEATTADNLVFAVVGDTRPPSENDIGAYPTSIITAIYGDIAKRNPLFVVGTGDYQFSSTLGSHASDQMDLYLNARAQYAGPFYPVMGNHECTGMTASNCGQGAADGITANYTAFLTKMLAPIRKTDPYYSIKVSAKDGSWTAKFVFVALNAWSDAQGTWLDGALSDPTTYTFVVHHEPGNEYSTPGTKPAQAILAKHPYTLALVGHTHTYRKPYGSYREVIIGNGGAPATGSVNYGYGLFQRRADGAVQVDMIDYQTKMPTPSLAFVVKADGTMAE
ncbi:MAG TPA: metallophosphoesterase [Labilithrix sp.]|jgi:hypothetical protein